MKSKCLFGLVALVVVLAAAQSSYAQVNITLSQAGPSQNEVATNRNAQAFDPLSTGSGLQVSGTVLIQLQVTATSLFLDYPGSVTAACKTGSTTGFPGAPGNGGSGTAGCTATGIPDGDPIQIQGASGIFQNAFISSINYGTGVIEIALPSSLAPTSGAFRLVGVRLDANGLTAPATVVASLGNFANNYQMGTPSTADVIKAFSAGMTGPTIGTRSSSTASSGNSITVFTNRTVPTFSGTAVNGVSFILNEGFESAWRAPAQETSFGGTAAGIKNGTQIRLTFTGLQSGMTLSLTTVTGGSLGAALKSGSSITSSSNVAVIDFTNTDLAAKEILQVNAVLSTPSTSGSAFTSGPIQVTATLFPNSAGLKDDKSPQTDPYPNFAQSDLGPLTIGQVQNPTTTLLIPYAVTDLGFDTGIAVANTTADPFGGSLFGGAVAGSGPVAVSLYGRTATGATPTVVTINTSATVRPGAGLDASGSLNSGSTWTVLLSELRTAAGQTGTFTGYIFIQVPFLDAHGASFISDFRSFTSASPVMVVPPVSTQSRNAGVEALNN